MKSDALQARPQILFKIIQQPGLLNLLTGTGTRVRLCDRHTRALPPHGNAQKLNPPSVFENKAKNNMKIKPNIILQRHTIFRADHAHSRLDYQPDKDLAARTLLLSFLLILSLSLSLSLSLFIFFVLPCLPFCFQLRSLPRPQHIDHLQ
jgi:hypothetical protein